MHHNEQFNLPSLFTDYTRIAPFKSKELLRVIVHTRYHHSLYFQLEPLHDHVISNRESGKDIREAIEYWHERDIASPRRKIVKSKTQPRVSTSIDSVV